MAACNKAEARVGRKARWGRPIAALASRQLRAGIVWLNTVFEMDPVAPFGGYKQSGLGRELGPESIDHFTQIKTVVLRY